MNGEERRVGRPCEGRRATGEGTDSALPFAPRVLPILTLVAPRPSLSRLSPVAPRLLESPSPVAPRLLESASPVAPRQLESASPVAPRQLESPSPVAPRQLEGPPCVTPRLALRHFHVR